MPDQASVSSVTIILDVCANDATTLSRMNLSGYVAIVERSLSRAV